MEVLETGIQDLYLLKPKVFEDSRGYFFESYNQNVFNGLGIKDDFIQDNQSMSMKNALRGLHFQKEPYAQAKLVRVSRGVVFDVVVDLRKDSKTYGKTFAVELSEHNKLMMYIPVGFAHGFCTLEDHTIFQYKCSNLYHPKTEGGLIWNDPDLAIQWPISAPIISEKDQKLPLFGDFISPF